MKDNSKVILISVFLVFVVCVFLFANQNLISGSAVKAVAQCKDGVDNDGDGRIDFPSDPGCSSKTDNSELNLNVQCDDGLDNDGDKLVDMKDAGCASLTDNDESNCGDRVCEGGETVASCPVDCGYPNSCSDTDGGNIIEVLGTVSGYLSNSWYSNADYCIDSGTIAEYYCSASTKQAAQISCGVDAHSIDYCLNGSVYNDFTDYYCSAGVCSHSTSKQLVQTCNYGCTNGICSAAPKPDSCADSDGGSVIGVKGIVSGYLNNNPYSQTDICANPADVIEYFCVGNVASSNTTGCGIDSYTPSYCLNSSVYRDFLDYYCDNGACGYLLTSQFVQACDYGCDNGACLPGQPQPNLCQETDYGDNKMTYGSVSGYFNNVAYSNNDYCVDSNTVMEYWCVGSEKSSQPENCGTDQWGPVYCQGSSLYKTFYDYQCGSGKCFYTQSNQLVQNCPFGCVSGQCKSSINYLCNDTDGGKNFATRGTVGGYYNGLPFTYTDRCISLPDGGVNIQEYYCYGAQYTETTERCANCVDGTCTELLPVYAACIAEAGIWDQNFGGITGTPSYNAPDLDLRYAKYKLGLVQGFNQAKELCTDQIFRSLMPNYCSVNTGKYPTCSWGVALYSDPNAMPFVVGGASSGSQHHDCFEASKPDSCADNDLGVNLKVEGTVTGYRQGSNYSFRDHCLVNVRNQVLENYCAGSTPSSSSYICNGTTVCLSGKCV
ncbi:MAG: hypothetical protein V1837_01265 [Candidatus Woesearchaeota archaeon]